MIRPEREKHTEEEKRCQERVRRDRRRRDLLPEEAGT
jgi:hypothetical protein